MRLYRERSIALIVDTQERLFPHIDGHEALAGNMARLIRGLAILRVPLLWAQQYTRGLGETIPVLAELLREHPRFEKMSFSCCGEPSLLSALKLSGRRCVIIAGIEAHVCVLQTALDLLSERFVPVVPEDCVSSRRPADRAAAIERMRQEGTRITTSESLLFELLGAAGTDTFREISRLVK
jgi:nicotinamidase-related amidase